MVPAASPRKSMGDFVGQGTSTLGASGLRATTGDETIVPRAGIGETNSPRANKVGTIGLRAAGKGQTIVSRASIGESISPRATGRSAKTSETISLRSGKGDAIVPLARSPQTSKGETIDLTGSPRASKGVYIIPRACMEETVVSSGTIGPQARTNTIGPRGITNDTTGVRASTDERDEWDEEEYQRLLSNERVASKQNFVS